MSVASTSSALFRPVQLGALSLSHRVVLAPLTRQRALPPNNVPQDLNAEYYSQRATEGGLLISEATQISASAQGYPLTPGIHSDEQVAGWKKVTDAVHKKKGLMALQLWHTGRVSNSSYQPSQSKAIAPSPIPIKEGISWRIDGKSGPFETPREATKQDIQNTLSDFYKATVNAFNAGFDAVEIHAANGYLINQFLEDNSNIRTDEYGGSIANRTRFLIEVLHTVIEAAGSTERVGIRLSPFGVFGEMHDSNKHALYTHVLSRLNQYKLAYVHLVEPDVPAGSFGTTGPDVNQVLKLKQAAKYSANNLIVCGGHTKQSATKSLTEGASDAVAFGRWFISNPDLPARLKNDWPFNKFDVNTFYMGTSKGYTDYPTYSPKSKL